MTVDLDSGTGLFDRCGKWWYLLSVINARMSGNNANDFGKELNDALVEYDGASNEIRSVIAQATQSYTAFQSSASVMHSAVRQIIQNTLIEMVDADDPQSSKTLAVSLAELIRQMTDNSETVDANEPTISTAAWGSNTGNPVFITSVLDGRGKSLQFVMPEDILVMCSDNDTAGSETLDFTGELNKSGDLLDWNWPSGSGASGSITVADPTSVGELGGTANGHFNTFTVANTPDNWTITTGTAGVEVFSESANVYRGAKCLKFDGAATLTKLSKTLTGLSALTPYAINVWTRVVVVPAAGTLQIDLWDGSAVINDEAGTANSLSINLTTETTSFASHSAVFRLPDPLPASVTLRVHLTAALSVGSQALIDDLFMGEMTEIYDGGPFVRVVTGNTAIDLDDRWEVTPVNDFRGDIQTWAYRTFGLVDQPLPSATGAAETVSDGLVA